MLKRFFEKLCCSHDWEERFRTSTHNHGETIPYKRTVTLICKKCGKIKQIDI